MVLLLAHTLTVDVVMFLVHTDIKKKTRLDFKVAYTVKWVLSIERGNSISLKRI